MGHSTINLAAQGVKVADTWAESITKVRISWDGDFDPNYAWCLDGYNEDTRELSEDVTRHRSHAAAVRAIPAWLTENGYTL
ncbi:MAG: hypothetical protein ACTH32_06590 [Microbacterium gubbeenense]|uniref:hypothetical protein n=1 Tax=Microbacterium gubbeenense TaxID=159896 RepID=UPI003F963036